MSERKWTPGPWVVAPLCAYGWDIRDAARDRWIGDAKCDHDQPERDVGGFPRNEEGLANAHLMAAAPDLYEALEELLPAFRAYLLEAGDAHDWAISDRAADALARARQE